MADDPKGTPTNPEPPADTGAGAVDANANLKAFMGEAYKEGLTLTDVESFLKGKKYADLNTGGYVAKGKYDALEKKYNDYTESTKDYQDLKAKNEEYAAKEKQAILKAQAAEAGIDEKFIKYALSELDPNTEDTAKALKEWVKNNPQFKVYVNPSRVITPINHEGGSNPKSMNEIINSRIRKSAGR